MIKNFILAGMIMLCSSINAQSQNIDKINQEFNSWLNNELWPQAKQRGIKRSSFDSAFSAVKPNLKLPDLIIPGKKAKIPKKQRQAEFRGPSAYFSTNIVDAVIRNGKKKLSTHRTLLKQIEKTTGVPGSIILAIWGRESAFGAAKIPYNAFQVLGTKAFMSTRKEYFKSEVLAALEMVQRHGIQAKLLKGSWAGALGQPQFMPSSYLSYARDFDGDRKADIWNSKPDILGSIANYLKQKGWVKGRDWGFEVNVPPDIPCYLEGPDRGKNISDWAKQGITRVSGKPFPKHELKSEGFLLMPAGRLGPAFIVTPNFFIIKEYNKSDLYALFVGHVGDRIIYGGSPFKTKWKKQASLYRSDIAKMQEKLERLGYDVGGADGLPGFKTRRSIGEWQYKNNMPQTCFPTKAIINAVR